MKPEEMLLKKEERVSFSLRALFEQYGYRKFKMSKFEEYDFYAENRSFLHSEAILTRNEAHAALFTAAVDSAAVYVNCSTRFTDGGEFGLGCEMGISTQKLHARGPMGLEELCSYKYIIHGSGQIR